MRWRIAVARGLMQCHGDTVTLVSREFDCMVEYCSGTVTLLTLRGGFLDGKDFVYGCDLGSGFVVAEFF